MDKPRILLPLVLTGLVVTAALTTAAVVDAAENATPRAKAGDAAGVPQAEVEALFAVAPLSPTLRARLEKEDAEAAYVQAEVDAMFAVAPMSVPRQASPAGTPQAERGRGIYLGLCFACHLPDGRGVAGVFPPLAGSDFLAADRERAIRIVLKGLIGPITVNGVAFVSAMPPLEGTLNDEQIADVLTYVTSEWGNRGAAFTSEEVRRVKNLSR